MLQLLVNLAAILGGIASAVQISESAAKARKESKLRRQLKRATITPTEALRSFRRQYPRTRVKLGAFPGGVAVLVVRAGDPVPEGSGYLGYQVIQAPEHW